MRPNFCLLLASFALFLAAACGPASGGGDDASDAGPAAPAAPTGLTVERLGEGGHITWTDASDDEDEFVIHRKEGAGELAERARVPFNTTQFHDEPLTAGATYTYMVMAVNAAGESASSEVDYTHE